MADSNVRVSNFPRESSGSPERVALDLMQWLKNTVPSNSEPDRKDRAYWLDFYAECLRATKNLRS